jgi:hypothetical protein
MWAASIFGIIVRISRESAFSKFHCHWYDADGGERTEEEAQWGYLS